MTSYIVWNANKTEGFVTTDKQLAYEIRKGADTNCYYANGDLARVARSFCEEHQNEDCTIQEIN